MKKKHWIIIIAILVVLSIAIFRPGGEDSWIRDERGVWIEHGHPSETPDYVLQQQQIINGALQLYNQRKSAGMEFSSQCLGTYRDYAVDIVHNPRTADDNLPQNQCSAYRSGAVRKFIELDKNGEVVKIT
ncbi:MAG: hypothetical protein ABIB79_05330 [archaeon]